MVDILADVERLGGKMSPFVAGQPLEVSIVKQEGLPLTDPYHL
jgi:hypothetical protein